MSEIKKFHKKEKEHIEKQTYKYPKHNNKRRKKITTLERGLSLDSP